MTDETNDQALSLDQLMATWPHQPTGSENERSAAENALILARLTVQLVELEMDERDANGDA